MKVVSALAPYSIAHSHLSLTCLFLKNRRRALTKTVPRAKNTNRNWSGVCRTKEK